MRYRVGDEIWEDAGPRCGLDIWTWKEVLLVPLMLPFLLLLLWVRLLSLLRGGR